MSPFVESPSVLASRFADAPVNPSLPENAKVLIFTAYERKGVIVMAAAGVTSCVLVSTLLLYIMFTALCPWPKRQQGPDSPIPFTRKQIAVFVICLLVSDLIQSISGITQVKWAMENRIYEGKSCSVQAATLVMGDLGSTVWSCVIAIHTFCGIALGKSWPRWAVITTVVTGWIFVILMTSIPPAVYSNNGGPPFFSIAGTWCFISSDYAIQRLGIHYIPLFVAAVVIFVFYMLVFLVLRGTVSFNGRRILPSKTRAEDVFMRERINIAKRMLWYPLAYLTCILPIAIIRLVGLRQAIIPESVWIFAMFFLFSLGAVDSIIYTTTRKLIKPISVSTHLRNFSDLTSSSGKSSFSLSRNPTQKTVVTPDSDKTNFVGVEQHEDSSKSTKFSAPPQGTTIHITLERIEEVI